jgi:hypothetical protein
MIALLRISTFLRFTMSAQEDFNAKAQSWIIAVAAGLMALAVVFTGVTVWEKHREDQQAATSFKAPSAPAAPAHAPK